MDASQARAWIIGPPEDLRHPGPADAKVWGKVCPALKRAGVEERRVTPCEVERISVETGDGFARDARCAGLPNVHERCATIRFWSRLPRCAILDAYHWRCMPRFHRKIGRSLAQFTSSSYAKRELQDTPQHIEAVATPTFTAFAGDVGHTAVCGLVAANVGPVAMNVGQRHRVFAGNVGPFLLCL